MSPEEIGVLWGMHELEDERGLCNGIEGVEEMLIWTDAQWTEFFKAKSATFALGFRQLVERYKQNA